MSTTFETVTIDRDRWGRPLIIPADGGKPQPYKRCTSYVDVLSDRFSLEKWMQRQVVVGLAGRRDLQMAAASLAADQTANKRALDDVCDQAREAAGASAKATIGTALHGFVERINRGEDPGAVPDEFAGHLANYRRVAGQIITRSVHVERFCVQDDLLIGGTPDLVAEVVGNPGLTIVDLKTGPATLKYGALKVAMQLAVYAHSVLYDADGTRRPMGEVNLDRGLVIGLDSDTGECVPYWVDLAAGWEAVQVAAQVHRWRAAKGLLVEAPIVPEPAPVATPKPRPVIQSAPAEALAKAIQVAPDVAALDELWRAAGPVWSDRHTSLARTRRATLDAA